MNIQYPPELQPLADQIVPIIEKTIQHYAGDRGMILAGYPLSREAYHRTLTDGVLVGDNECIVYEIKVDVTTGSRNRMSSSVARDMMQAELSRLLREHRVTVLRSDRDESKDVRDGHHYFRLAFIPAEVFGRQLVQDLCVKIPALFGVANEPELLLVQSAFMERAVWNDGTNPYWYVEGALNPSEVRAHFHKASDFNDRMLVLEAANALLAANRVEVLHLTSNTVLVSMLHLCPDLVLEDLRWAQAFYDREQYGLAVLGPSLPEAARDFLFPYAEHFHTCSTMGQFLKAIRLRGLPFPLPEGIIDDIIEHDRPLTMTSQFEIQFHLLHALVHDDNFRRTWADEQWPIRRDSLTRYVERLNAHAPSA